MSAHYLCFFLLRKRYSIHETREIWFGLGLVGLKIYPEELARYPYELIVNFEID